MYQFNFALLLEIFGAFCKTKSLAALVNEILYKLSPCFALCFLERRMLPVTTERYVSDTVIPGRERETVRVRICSAGSTAHSKSQAEGPASES